MAIAVAVAIFLSTAAIVLALICLRQLGEMYLVQSGLTGIQQDGLPIGDLPPRTTAVASDGSTVELRNLVRDRGGAYIVFSLQNCEICGELRRELQSSTVPPEGRTVIFVYDSFPEDLEHDSREHVVALQTVSPSRHARWRVRVSPFAFLLDTDGRIISKGLVNSTQDLLALGRPNGAVSDRDSVKGGSRDAP
jgi:hypothetical protein